MPPRAPITGALLATTLAGAPLGAQEAASDSVRAFTFRGEVRDYLTELPIPGATVQIVEVRRSAVTDRNGYFELPELLPDRYTFVTSGFGYETNREPSEVGLNAFMVVRLNPMAIPLEGIEVTVDRLIQQLEVRRLGPRLPPRPSSLRSCRRRSSPTSRPS